MDRNFYDNDFEEFLKGKADQYKMYPSDRVWNNIHSSLHGRRRWIAGFTILFIVSALLIGMQVALDNNNRLAANLNNNPAILFSPANTGNGSDYDNSNRQAPAVRPNTVAADISVYALSSPHAAVSLPSAGNSVNNNAVAGKISDKDLSVFENGPVRPVPEIQATPDLNIGFSVPEKQVVANKPDKINSVTAEVIRQSNQNKAAGFKLSKPSKWFIQFYASPIISYRRLSNLSQPYNNIPVSATYAGNINKYVRHTPAPGFELGSTIQYKLSNSLTLFAGAQLNYSRYYIDAYKYNVEKASIALKGSSAVPDTVSGYTNIRNFDGYAPEQLQNRYWQLSVPAGIQIKLLGNKKLQFSVAGGIQPTFIINSNSYLISSDYKNYIQSPDLARNFNVHTNFEAFVSYKTGGVKWQIGPQFRSQLLSSYSNKYGVREYLTEYGIKFGVTKSF